MSWLKGLKPFRITFCQKLSYVLCCFNCAKSGRQRRLEALISESESRMESMLDIAEFIKLTIKVKNFLKMNCNEIQDKLFIMQRDDRVLEKSEPEVSNPKNLMPCDKFMSVDQSIHFIRSLLHQEESDGRLNAQTWALINGVF